MNEEMQQLAGSRARDAMGQVNVRYQSGTARVPEWWFDPGMNSGCAQQTHQRPDVVDGCDRIGKSIDELRGTLATLAERLQQILTPDTTNAKQAGATMVVGRSNLGNALHSHADSIDELRRDAAALLNRLAV